MSESNLRHILYILENVPISTFLRLLEKNSKNIIKDYALLSIHNIMDENPLGVKHLIDNQIIDFLRNLVINILPTN